MSKEIFRNRPAVAFFMYQIFGWYFDIIKEHFIDLMATVHKHEGADGDPWRLHIEEEERNPFLSFRRIRIRAHKAEDPVGMMRPGRPDFLAVDDIVIALTFGTGLQ